MSLEYLTVPAVGRHSATVIFVHGLGDTGEGCKPVADAIRIYPGLEHIKWVLPHSPSRPVTASAGTVMPSWFDLYSFDFEGNEDENGILQSSRRLKELISAEVRAGIDPVRIVIGGFSQGGAMSLLTGLTFERRLAGVAVLSGWLPLRKTFKDITSPHAALTPIFWGHGINDPVVRYQLCTNSVEHMTRRCGIPSTSITRRAYEGLAHESSPEELEDLSAWLRAILPRDGK